MPELGESVTEGTVTRWLKKVGDEVAVDEPLLEVSTDKVDTEIPSPVAGTLLEITASEDDTVEVGGQLAVIGDASAAAGRGAGRRAGARGAEAGASRSSRSRRRPPRPRPRSRHRRRYRAGRGDRPSAEEVAAELPSRPDSGSASTDGSGDTSTGAPYVTPLVRKLAAEHDVDLSTITGTGVGGRIRKQDVLAAAEADERRRQPAAPAPAAASPARAVRPARRPAVPKPAANAARAGHHGEAAAPAAGHREADDASRCGCPRS